MEQRRLLRVQVEGTEGVTDFEEARTGKHAGDTGHGVRCRSDVRPADLAAMSSLRQVTVSVIAVMHGPSPVSYWSWSTRIAMSSEEATAT
jgi:hypothetical protein